MILDWNLDIYAIRVFTTFLVVFKSIRSKSIRGSIRWCLFDKGWILTFTLAHFSGCVWLLWFFVNCDYYCLRFVFISRSWIFCGLSNNSRRRWWLLLMRERPSLWWWILTCYRWDRDHWREHVRKSANLFLVWLLFFMLLNFGLSLLFLEQSSAIFGCLCCIWHHFLNKEAGLHVLMLLSLDASCLSWFNFFWSMSP